MKVAHLFGYRNEDDRLSVIPPRYPHLFDLYEKAQNAYWTLNEINFSEDVFHVKELSEAEHKALEAISIFFAIGDKSIVGPVENMWRDSDMPVEHNMFISLQISVEYIHLMTYNKQLSIQMPDEAKTRALMDSWSSCPSIVAMKDWYEAQSRDSEMYVRLIRNICFEGLFFTCCFCIIYWFANKNKLPGICQANRLISRDEQLHATYNITLFCDLIVKPAADVVKKLFQEAVELCKNFAKFILREPLEDVNATNMGEFIEFTADNLIYRMGYSKVFGKPNPLKFMIQQSMESRTDFFAKKVTDYSKPVKSAVSYEFDRVVDY